jgi:hypothetical protein
MLEVTNAKSDPLHILYLDLFVFFCAQLHLWNASETPENSVPSEAVDGRRGIRPELKTIFNYSNLCVYRPTIRRF